MSNTDDIERPKQPSVYTYRATGRASSFFAPLRSDLDLYEEALDLQKYWGLDIDPSIHYSLSIQTDNRGQK